VEGPTSWRCDNGHSFDRAREGYVNLLRAGRKPSRAAGDDAEMLRARRRLFDAGHYGPVIDAVAAATADLEPASVLDAGCGEGTYLAAVVERTGAEGVGVDIAKAAVAMAARRHRRCRFAVASVYELPFDDGAFDAVLSVFAPRPFEELARVARAVVTASPGPDHLDGLRALVYDAARPHEERPHHGDAVARVRYRLTLSEPDAVEALVHMTPYWWQGQARDRLPDQLETTVDVIVAVHPGFTAP